MSDARSEIAGLLKAVESAARAGTNAKQLVELLYDESLVAVVEGADRATHGINEFIPRLEQTLREWGPRPDVSLELCEPVLSCESLVVSFVNARIRADFPNAEVQRLRAMLAFRRSNRGWRLVLEMYAAGVV